MAKLNPEDLVVSSFETEAQSIDRSLPGITTTNDPTAATRCYICPQETYNSCDLFCPKQPITIPY